MVVDNSEPSVAVGGQSPVHVRQPAEFQRLLDESDVVLVDFHATWCGPCHMIEPIVTSIAETTEATVAKVDVDEHPQLAAAHQVQGVPTLLLAVNGEIRERFVGVQSEADLRAAIETHRPNP